MKMNYCLRQNFFSLILSTLILSIPINVHAAIQCDEIGLPLIGEDIIFVSGPVDSFIGRFRWPEDENSLRRTIQVRPLNESRSFLVFTTLGRISREYIFSKTSGTITVREYNFDSLFPQVKTQVLPVLHRRAPTRMTESIGPVETVEYYSSSRSNKSKKKTVRSGMIYQIPRSGIPTAHFNEIGIFEFTDGSHAVLWLRDTGRFNSQIDLELSEKK